MKDYLDWIGNANYKLSLNGWATVCHMASVDAGWWDPPAPVGAQKVAIDRQTPIKLLLIHAEISEAVEGFRKGLMDDHLPEYPMLAVELADAFIRLVDLAGAHDFDLDAIVRQKLLYNAQRADHKPENRAKEGGKKF